MFNSESNNGKITVRSLPSEVLTALSLLSEQNDRSLEAEARQALKTWVKPTLAHHEHSLRVAELSQRLAFLKKELEKLWPTKRVSPSRIAEALSWSYAEPVELWFSGKIEPSLAELTQLSELFGCSKDWLIHGEGQPYAAMYTRIPEDGKAGSEFLLSPSDSKETPSIHLVRSKSEAGEFLFVKEYSVWSSKAFCTPYHISEVIGNGGESSLASLSLVLKYLYKEWTTGKASDVSVAGYLVSEDSYSKLISGESHPLNIIKNAEKSCWWEDFWDESQFSKQNYWDGWSNITRRIYNVVESSPRLKEQRDDFESDIT